MTDPCAPLEKALREVVAGFDEWNAESSRPGISESWFQSLKRAKRLLSAPSPVRERTNDPRTHDFEPDQWTGVTLETCGVTLGALVCGAPREAHRAPSPVREPEGLDVAAEAAHNAWYAEKKRRLAALGLDSWPSESGEEQLRPWSELSEPVREFDRIVVRAILAILAATPERPAAWYGGNWSATPERPADEVDG